MAAAIPVRARTDPLRGVEAVHSPWVGVDLAADRIAWARLLRRAHDVALGGGGTPAVVRGVIGRSWERCRGAGVDPDRPAPIVLTADEAADRFARHPLAAVVARVRELLGAVTVDARHLVALSDADGTLLWAEGHPSMLEAAIRPRFVPGSLVSEEAVGTNAVGTALALDHALQVFSAEHFNRLLHGWSGAAAPIHHPASGELVGALDLSSSFRTAHPHTLTLVEGVARAAEAALAREQQRLDAESIARYVERLPAGGRRPSALVAHDGRVLLASPRGWLGRRVTLPHGAEATALADGTRVRIEPIGAGARVVWGVRPRQRRAPRHALHVHALAPGTPAFVLDGRRLQLTARQVEIVVLLALAPGGLTAHDLARALYGPGAKPVTARAEVARLRKRVGDLVLPQPYRLAADVGGDVVDVDRLLRRGDAAAAAEIYTGALLPSSRAPAIVAARARLEAALSDARTVDERSASRTDPRRAQPRLVSTLGPGANASHARVAPGARPRRPVSA
jgi:GAF domain